MTPIVKQSLQLAALMIGLAVGLPQAQHDDPLPRARPEAVGVSPEALAQATALLDELTATRTIAGAVAAVARHGQLVYLEAVGTQDLETGAPMTARTIFRIYSMAKPVTAVAVMMLRDEGRLGLDDPVSKYLPEFGEVFVQPDPAAPKRPPARPITVRDLLLHTSGLSHRTSELYREARVRSRGDSLPQFVRKIVRAPLMEDPGTRFRYSEATTVLGRLVELRSGVPFDAFLEARLFEPLGMRDTAFWVPPERRNRLATVYGPVEGGDGLRPVEIEEIPFTARPALIEGAVGLVSTVPDYVRFSQMLVNRGELDGVRLLKPETVDEMTGNGLPEPVLRARGTGAMGWGLANVNVLLDPAAAKSSANRGEYGWDGTAGTIFWIDPQTQMVTILMTQSAPANPGSIRQRFKAIVQSGIR